MGAEPRRVTTHKYPPVRQCIYCRTTALSPGLSRFTDEHIIPLALGGNLLLREASCTCCMKIINQQIESLILLKEWGYFRIKRNFPTRNKNNRKEARETLVTLRQFDGLPMQIGVLDYSCPVPLYKFKEARIFSGVHRNDGVHWSMDILTTHEDEMEMQSKFPNWNREHIIIPRPYEFARLLAKIAYSYAAAEYGIEGFTPFITDIILGYSVDYFHLIGGSWYPQPAIPHGDHITDIRITFKTERLALLWVEVRLFSEVSTPAYHVVVGEIDFNDPQHLLIFRKHAINGKIPNIPTLVG